MSSHDHLHVKRMGDASARSHKMQGAMLISQMRKNAAFCIPSMLTRGLIDAPFLPRLDGSKARK
jgi:hypothetical protein